MKTRPNSRSSRSATACGIALPPPDSSSRLASRSRASRGLASRSITIVGMQVQRCTRWRSMRSSARSRSQRGISTSVPAASTDAHAEYTNPVMWNIGTAASATVPAAVPPAHRPVAIALCCRLA